MFKSSLEVQKAVRKNGSANLEVQQQSVTRQASKEEFHFVEVERVTEAQRKVLRESFELLEQESTRNGLSVFVRLFQEYPEYKGIFPKFRYLTDEAVSNSCEIRAHGDLYMRALRTIILSLHDDQVLTTHIRSIAATHERKGVKKFHVENMLPKFLKTLQISKGSVSKEEEEAWTVLYGVIADLIERMRHANE